MIIINYGTPAALPSHGTKCAVDVLRKKNKNEKSVVYHAVNNIVTVYSTVLRLSMLML